MYFKPGFDRECTTVATNVDGAPKVEPVPAPGADRQRDRELRRHPRQLTRGRHVTAALDPLVAHAARAAVLVDFDGSLSPIVADPDAARPAARTRDALAGLVGQVGRVAVVSGRPVAFLRAALGIDGVTYVGQYGLERWDGERVVTDPRVEPFLPVVAEVAAAAEPGAARAAGRAQGRGRRGRCTGGSAPIGARRRRPGRPMRPAFRARAAPGEDGASSSARRSRWTRAGRSRSCAPACDAAGVRG